MADEPKVQAGEEQAAQESEAASAGMPKQKKIMIFAGIFVVQAVAVIGLGQILIKPRIAPPDTAVVEKAPDGRGTIMMLEDLTANLQSGKRPRYLRVKIGLEVSDPVVEAELEERQPEIRDLVITSLSGRKVDQLISVQGKDQLKEELKNRINNRLQEGELMNVYFSDFVVQ